MSSRPDTKTSLSNKNRFLNNFDFLRLLGAFLVIYSHSFPLTGNGMNEPLFSLTGFLTLGNLGVIIFFVISGYLIPSSWLRKPDLIGFFKNRILRIVPGLFTVALVSIFIIGPLVTIIPLVDYFQNPMTWRYFLIVCIYYIGSGYLPGVFVNNVFPNAVNGSLWMIPLLFNMYIITAIAGYFNILKKRKIILISTILLAITSFLCEIGLFNKTLFGLILSNKIIVYMFSANLFFPIFFMIGVLFYLYKDKIKFDIKICVLFILLILLLIKTDLLSLVLFIAAPYILLYVAFTQIPYLNRIGKYGDFSYGLYIFAFPIQQSIEYFIPSISVLGMFLLSSLIVIPISILSYKLIESKALKLKDININVLFKNR